MNSLVPVRSPRQPRGHSLYQRASALLHEAAGPVLVADLADSLLASMSEEELRIMARAGAKKAVQRAVNQNTGPRVEGGRLPKAIGLIIAGTTEKLYVVTERATINQLRIWVNQRWADVKSSHDKAVEEVEAVRALLRSLPTSVRGSAVAFEVAATLQEAAAA